MRRAIAQHAQNQEVKDINNCENFFPSPSVVKEILWSNSRLTLSALDLLSTTEKQVKHYSDAAG